LVIAVGNFSEVEHTLEVKQDTDLDSMFTGFCVETGDTVRVNGWQCHIEILADL
jgi:hypothetical protein